MFRPSKTSKQSPAKPQSAVANSEKNKGLCKYPHRNCNLVCLESYAYCLKHILEDKSAPYKPCPFVYTVSGKKCGKPSHWADRKDSWVCPEHSRKSQYLRQKSSSRHAPPQTQEGLLASLKHYAPEQLVTCKKEKKEGEDVSVKHAVNPFVDIDAAQVNSRSNQTLDYASESDSDLEGATLDNVWRAQDHESSDAESVDSQAEDPLKHAGVYTAEEVTVVIKDKMIRLQSLYIDQFRRLQHLLKERRRKYLHTLKKEKETLCSIHDQEKTTPNEQKLYLKLKALNHFHKYYGEDAVLHKKALERRLQVTEGHLGRRGHKGKCTFTEGGVKCGAKTLPVTKYCRKHILEDTQQVLFRACGIKRDDHTCKEPTLNVFENTRCVYHVNLPSPANSPPKVTNAKEELKPENINIDDGPKELINDNNKLTTDDTSLCLEKKSQPEIHNDPLINESTSISTSKVADQDITIDKNLEPVEIVEKSCPENEVSEESLPIKAEEDNNLTLPEPMEQEQGQEEKVEVNKETDETKTTNSSDELVMIDMMTDVGVVEEEVLESEAKQDTEESMLIDHNEHNVESKQEP